jgi:hypothetical protein
MAGNRKAAEKTLLHWINELSPGNENVQIYKNLFASMSDDQFDEFMGRLERDEITLAFISPIANEHKLTVERNLNLAEQMGHNFFEQIWVGGDDGNPRYLSNKKYLIVDLPLRRQAQLLVKKISIPEDNRSVDNLTGQPTGDSKGSKISYPELQILASQQLDNTITEFIKYRGGDTRGFIAMNDSIAKSGGVSLTALAALNTRVKATETMQTYLTCMHLQSSLIA